ncbi:MAG TPA: SagB/ThcOx family dehydrogenase [Dongiaceae bacterium]|nr:SagB/ThcOx family dehydrogenase [Dongiaceae bacterium]
MRHQFLTLVSLSFFLAPGCFPAEQASISLPRPKKAGSVSVEAALGARRSVRGYAEQPLTLAEIGQLLWAAQGVTSDDGKRTAPSAMHRYPLEIAVVAQNVDGLPSGAYRYVPAKHSLEPLVVVKPGTPLLASSTTQTQVHSAPAVFVISAVYERMGSGAKNHTWTDYEAGLASENLLLEAVALGLGAVVTGGIEPASVKEAVKLMGGEEVIVVIPVGHPVK